ncbi:MAG: cell envelope-related function transcriptional attenuator common domain [Bacillota bacterium]|nr:cell envelope-related function transcriptional attenuator common domain [Bacillota bacterium]
MVIKNDINKLLKNKKIGILISTVQSIIAVAFINNVILLNIIPNKYIYSLIIILLLFSFLSFTTQINVKFIKIGKLFILLIISILVICFIYLNKINKMLIEISNSDSTTEYHNQNQNQNYMKYVGTKNLFSEKEKNYIKDNFIVYISGVDTYGDISEKSRSDVNIIACINTNTKNILLISTPRDYYVEIPMDGGSMDKLTHTGIYGVGVSIKALEKLYNISIDYYVRVNFSSYIYMVDLLGGITVNSDYTFKSGNYSFNEGENKLNGKEALAFVRERYAFSNGDIQRGENQMQVIKSLFNKALSPTNLLKSYEIVETICRSIETNMLSNEMKALIKMLINDGTSYNIIMYSVKGTGDKAITYSGGNKELYVMIPDEKSIIEAKNNIKKIINKNFNKQISHDFYVTY